MERKLLNDSSIKNEIYFDLGENSFLPVFWLKRDGKLFHVNNAACEHLGYTYDELTNLNITDINPVISIDQLSDIFEMLSKCRVYKLESRHIRKDGTVVDIEIVANYFIKDNIEFVLSYVFDISSKKNKEKELEKKTEELKEINSSLETMIANRTKELEEKIAELEKTEKMLRASEKMFINAFKTSQDSINVNRLEDGTYLKINEGFTNILGYTEEEVIGKSSLALNIWKDPADRAKLVAGVKKDGYYHNLEADFVHKDGSIINGLMSATIQEMDGELVLLNVSKDITKLKSMEKELKKLNDGLMQRVQEEINLRKSQEGLLFEQRKFAEMGQMMSAIAHQWRQPLNNIHLIAQAMQEIHSGEDLGIPFNELYEKHGEIVRHMSDTIDDFRYFFSPGKSKVPFNIVKELLVTTDLIKAQYDAHHIAINVMCGCEDQKIHCSGEYIRHYCGKGNDTITGYPGEIRQVFLNLLSNAKDAIIEASEKYQHIERVIDIQITVNSKEIIFRIHNNGKPIPDEYMSKIFDPYFTTKDEGKGTGIGLYMSRLIVEKNMKGKITCKNTPKGVCFTVAIPR